MRPRIGVAFAHFWPGFHPDAFAAYFPQAFETHDFYLSPNPQIVFQSVFHPGFVPYEDQRRPSPVAEIPRGAYVRVFLTGENVEPDMTKCEFAISFSRAVEHPNHLRLPLWVYENSASGFPPEALLRDPGTDWEKLAAGKTKFCNFVYSHDVPLRAELFAALSRYKHIDSAGRVLNNMDGWSVPISPSRLAGKIGFLRDYKFTLAVENTIWPGYTTEKLADPFYANSIPIYVGDPSAREQFSPGAFIDGTGKNVEDIVEMVRDIDGNDALYLKMLATPPFADNTIPEYARSETIRAFFERIFAAVAANN